MISKPPELTTEPLIDPGVTGVENFEPATVVDTRRVLVVAIAGRTRCAHIGDVREIVPIMPTTRLPGAPGYVRGLINLRGVLVTLLDAALCLYGVPSEDVNASILLVERRGRVAGVIVLHPDGKVLGQFGFSSSSEVMTACTLAAAINASGRELGRQLGGRPFSRSPSGRAKPACVDGLVFRGRPGMSSPRRPSTGIARSDLCVSTSPNFGMQSWERTKLRQSSGSGWDLETDLNSSLDALFGPLN